jgi:ParB family chromosome partitioning protein
MGKPKLGRGLASLLSPIEQHIQTINVEQIRLTPLQKEEKELFPIQELEELAEELHITGLSTPFSVRKEGTFFLLLDDLKIYCAACFVFEVIPILLRKSPSSNEDPILQMLEEGESNPIELAQTYSSIMLQFQLTQEQLSNKIKRSRSSIANILRLLNLPFDIRADIQAGRLCSGHGLALLRLTQQEQRFLYLEIKEKRLTIAQTNELAQKRQAKINRHAELEQLLQDKSMQHNAGFKVHSKGTVLNIDFPSREHLILFLKDLS